MKKLISHSILVGLLKSKFGGVDDIPPKLQAMVTNDKNNGNYLMLFYIVDWWIAGSYNIQVNIRPVKHWDRELYKTDVLETIAYIIMKFGKFPPSATVMLTMGGKLPLDYDEKI